MVVVRLHHLVGNEAETSLVKAVADDVQREAAHDCYSSSCVEVGHYEAEEDQLQDGRTEEDGKADLHLQPFRVRCFQPFLRIRRMSFP